MENETVSDGSPATDRLSKQRRYRRLMFGSLFGGVVVGLVLRIPLDYPLVGEAVYWVGIVGFLAAWWLSPVTLFDERDRSIERRASQVTLLLAGVVLVLAASASRVATHTGVYDVPSEVWAVLYGYVALFVTFGAVYGLLRYRS